MRRSGLDELRSSLANRFTERRDLLKARSALLAVDFVLRREPAPQGRSLLAEVERILAGSHEFAEIRLLAAIRSSAVTFPDAYRAEAERLLGANGTSPAQRLGLVDDTDPGTLRAVALETLERWRRLSENPASRVLSPTRPGRWCAAVRGSCTTCPAGERSPPLVRSILRGEHDLQVPKQLAAARRAQPPADPGHMVFHGLGRDEQLGADSL